MKFNIISMVSFTKPIWIVHDVLIKTSKVEQEVQNNNNLEPFKNPPL